METCLKTGFAQIFSCCPKFGGAAAPLAPPGPYAYVSLRSDWYLEEHLTVWTGWENSSFSSENRRWPAFLLHIGSNARPIQP